MQQGKYKQISLSPSGGEFKSWQVKIGEQQMKLQLALHGMYHYGGDYYIEIT